MSDVQTENIPPQVQVEVDKIVDTTKRGFDLKARMAGRGLRKATITLFLDEEAATPLGWAIDILDSFDKPVGRDRGGILGDIDRLQEERAKIVEARRTNNLTAPSTKKVDENAPVEFDEEIAALEKERDEIVAELVRTGITVKMRAVPPIIQKDCRRKAKLTLGITEKQIPKDNVDDFNIAFTAYLMSHMIQEVTDNATGDTNVEFTYQDAIDLMDYLPPGQNARLDLIIGQVQFTDAISRTIERQEDFS